MGGRSFGAAFFIPRALERSQARMADRKPERWTCTKRITPVDHAQSRVVVGWPSSAVKVEINNPEPYGKIGFVPVALMARRSLDPRVGRFIQRRRAARTGSSHHCACQRVIMYPPFYVGVRVDPRCMIALTDDYECTMRLLVPGRISYCIIINQHDRSAGYPVCLGGTSSFNRRPCLEAAKVIALRQLSLRQILWRTRRGYRRT